MIYVQLLSSIMAMIDSEKPDEINNDVLHLV